MSFIGHNLDCNSRLAQMIYDGRCPRCAKIKQVIALRRKTVGQGASPEEERAAQTLSDKLVLSAGLTRGEVFDRLYSTAPTKSEYLEEKVWETRRKWVKTSTSKSTWTANRGLATIRRQNIHKPTIVDLDGLG